MELPSDDMEMSKHVGLQIVCRDTVVIVIVLLLVVIKTVKDARHLY